MSEDRAGDRARTTRRAFVALAGSAALAGCNGFPGVGDDAERTVALDALRPPEGASYPQFSDRIPVDVETSYLDEAATAARSSLSTVPAPLEASEIPNGAIRADLRRRYDGAIDLLGRRAEAPSPAAELELLRGARRAAGGVAAGWRAVEGEFGMADVRDRAAAALDDLGAFRRRWRYAGDDPVRAVLVHGRIEAFVASAGQHARNPPGRGRGTGAETAILVADAGSDVADARASLADASYLFDRYESSLEDPAPTGPAFRAAASDLSASYRDRVEKLPGRPRSQEPNATAVPEAVRETPTGYALRELRDVEADYELRRYRRTGQRARVVLTLHDALTRLRAYDRLRERVEAGDYVRIEDTASVRRARDAAVEAVESARAASQHERLNRRQLHRLTGLFEYLVDDLDRHWAEETAPLDSLRHELSWFPYVEAVARATPAASAEVAQALRSVET